MSRAGIPFESCMFAQLPRSSGSKREQRQELKFAFEAILPIPVDQCQMAFAVVDQSIIGCAVRKTLIASYRSTHETAIPRELPDWVPASEQAQCRAQLNLLTGEMESLIRINRRNRTLQMVSIVAVFIAVIVFVALQRQSNAWVSQAAEARGHMQAMNDSVLPLASGNAQPDPIRFAMLLNQVSSTRTGTRDQAQHRLVEDLALLLEDWPESAEARVRSMSLDHNTIRLEMSLPNNELALSMLSFLSAKKDWDVRSREISPAADRVQLGVQLSRQGEGGLDA